MSIFQPDGANGTNINSLKKGVRLLNLIPRVRAAVEAARTGESESYLCDVCETIDLRVESFVVSATDNGTARINRVRYLGQLTKIRHKTHCPFCRLVLDIADRPPDQRAPSHVEDNPTVYARWVVDGQEDLGPDPRVPGEHVFSPKTRRLLIYSDPQAFKDGYLVLLGEDAPSPSFFGRRVSSPDLLDTNLIRTWIRDCETLHGAECEESLVHPDLVGEKRTHILRAVDVHLMCIVEPPNNCRYVALSYLWGRNFNQLFTTSQNLARLSTPGALEKEKLPRTIKDSIKLTRMLGERYLWTDSLALLHDEGFKYHDDWIYARAALTVVAGSGKDANAGLPGVRKLSRTFRQEIEEVKPGLRLMVSHLAEDYISTSQWDSRAWTFQERMLSRRCLLFVNGRIYYQCRRTTFCEDIEMPRSNGWSLDSIDMPTRIFRERPFVQFTSAVELYTRRELTNPDDILNGFEGVERVLEKRLLISIYYGALESRMDASLLWESAKRLRRRRGFPSWSWSGWLGEIQWKLAEDPQSWIDWQEQSAQSSHQFPAQDCDRCAPPIPFPDDEAEVTLRDPSISPAILCFKTVTAIFRLTMAEVIHKSVISPLRKRLTGPSALSTVRPAPADPKLIRAGISDRDGIWCGTINLDEWWLCQIGRPLEFLIMSKVDRFTDDELALWEGLLPDDVEDIIERRRYGAYNVLLITRDGNLCYRQGIGRILIAALEKSLSPGPKWKDVLLG